MATKVFQTNNVNGSVEYEWQPSFVHEYVIPWDSTHAQYKMGKKNIEFWLEIRTKIKQGVHFFFYEYFYEHETCRN